MPRVMVVPETEEFEMDVSHDNVVWVTKKLGIPHLDDNDARYIAPLWLKSGGTVTRIYHILGARDDGESTEIKLGNSFVLRTPWSDAGQHRRFEYRELAEFGMAEICPGLLLCLE